MWLQTLFDGINFMIWSEDLNDWINESNTFFISYGSLIKFYAFKYLRIKIEN